MLNIKFLKKRFFSSFLYFAVICFMYSDGFAQLSNTDKWDYNRAILESRVSFYEKLVDDLTNSPSDEEELSELLASIIYEDPSTEDQAQIRKSLQEKERTSGNPFFNDLIFNVYSIIARFNYFPLVSILEKITEGEESFKGPFMKEKLEGLHKLISENQIKSHDKSDSQTFNLSILLTIYWEVEQQTSNLFRYQEICMTAGDSLSGREKREKGLVFQTIQSSTNFLKQFKGNLLDMISEVDSEYASLLKEFEGNQHFYPLRYITSAYTEELVRLVNNEAKMRKDFYELQKIVHEKIGREKPKNQQLKELLSLKLLKEKSISDRNYFKDTLLPRAEEKSLFLKDSLRSDFKNLTLRMNRFLESRDPVENLQIKERIDYFLHYWFIGPFINEIESLRVQIQFHKNLARTSFDFQKWFESEQETIRVSSFAKYAESLVSSSFLEFKRLSSELNREAEFINGEILNLKRSIRNRSKIHDREAISPADSQEKQSANSSELEAKSSKVSDSSSNIDKNPTLQSVEPTEVLSGKEGEVPGFENTPIEHESEPRMEMSKDERKDQRSTSDERISQLQTHLAKESLVETQSEPMQSDIEIGATTFFTPIEDKYKADIREKMIKKHLDNLRSIYSEHSVKFRFETLENLVKRCGGVLQFSGQGGSHFQITLPGGYTSYGWRPHGKAHSSKIQGKILNAFRDAFKGVAEILGIQHDTAVETEYLKSSRG